MKETIELSTTHTGCAPINQEERMFLLEIQDPQKRKEVIAILMRAGLTPS